jgi:sulfur relay (sulfurtransferase) DsrF/TusC family protein
VVAAIEALKQANAILGVGGPEQPLFQAYFQRAGRIMSDVTPSLIINNFATRHNVALYNDSVWQFSSHQFRKTFARFVATRDKTQLLGLAEHFKHAQIYVTSGSYVGYDFELSQLIGAEVQEQTALALATIINADRLAGRMGERIEKSPLFRGRIGAELRDDYVAFILSETDLAIHACEYGWCVFQPEVAKCGGTAEPDYQTRTPRLCSGCTNFVATEEHTGYWLNRRDRNAELLKDASQIARQALEQAISECDGILNALSRAPQ